LKNTMALFTLALLLGANPSVAKADTTAPVGKTTSSPAAATPEAGPPTTELPVSVETKPLPDVIDDVATPSPKTEAALAEGKEKQFGVSLAFSPLGILIPTKYGPAANWNINRRWSLEISSFGGSYGFSSSYFDLGGFKENLLLLNARYFPRAGSFNWLFGISRQQYIASLGNDIVSRFATYVPDYSITVETVGLQLGLGNRWTYKRLLLGVDWLVLNIPVIASRTSSPALDQVTNADDRRRIDDAIRVMRYLPTGALAKLSLGFAF
jgi:hypothetical protein